MPVRSTPCGAGTRGPWPGIPQGRRKASSPKFPLISEARGFLTKLNTRLRRSGPLLWKLPWYFGSGSLTYCMTLPFHNLSIPRSFEVFNLLQALDFCFGLFSFDCKIPGRLPRAHPLSLQSNQQTSPSHQAGSERPNQRSRNHPAQLSTCSSMTVVPSVRFL